MSGMPELATAKAARWHPLPAEIRSFSTPPAEFLVSQIIKVWHKM
jgi:hypothetical protein